MIPVIAKEGSTVADEFGRRIPHDRWVNVLETKKIKKALRDGKISKFKKPKAQKRPKVDKPQEEKVILDGND